MPTAVLLSVCQHYTLGIGHGLDFNKSNYSVTFYQSHASFLFGTNFLKEEKKQNLLRGTAVNKQKATSSSSCGFVLLAFGQMLKILHLSGHKLL